MSGQDVAQQKEQQAVIWVMESEICDECGGWIGDWGLCESCGSDGVEWYDEEDDWGDYDEAGIAIISSERVSHT